MSDINLINENEIVLKEKENIEIPNNEINGILNTKINNENNNIDFNLNNNLDESKISDLNNNNLDEKNDITNLNNISNEENKISDLNNNNLDEKNNLNNRVKKNTQHFIIDMNIRDLLEQFRKEIEELEKCLGPEELKNNIHILGGKQKFMIIFLWLIWLINITIFITGDLSLLFFSGSGIFSLIFTIVLCTCIVIIETLNIINKQYKFFVYEYIIFSGYFWMLLIILLRSLMNSKGWGWQFYLIFILININLIIIPKFNIDKFKKD